MGDLTSFFLVNQPGEAFCKVRPRGESGLGNERGVADDPIEICSVC